MILDLASGVLTDGDKVAKFTPQQAEVIAAIVGAYPGVTSRDTIINRVWPGERKPRFRSLSSTLYLLSCKMLEAGISVPWAAQGYGLKAVHPVDIVGVTRRVSVDRGALEKATAFLMTHPDIAARLVVLSLAA